MKLAAISALRAVALWLVLIMVGSCSLGEPTLTGHDSLPLPRSGPVSRDARGTGAMTPAQRAAYVAAVQREASSSHRLEPTVHGFRGKSSTALRARFGAEGVEVAAGEEQPSHQWRAEATRWGCEGELIPVTETTPEASDNRATYHRRGFDEWYVVGPLGIEQGFTVTAPPACRARGGEGVMIALASSGLRARLEPNGTAAALVDPTGKEVLRYTDLYVVDAAGNELSAELRVQAGALAIWFDDRGATYPVTVDPLIGVPQQTLIASDPAPSNDFGGSVALSGDTVVVGASGNADFEGAAYVFVRSGGTWSLQQKLTAGEDPITRRIFGTSGPTRQRPTCSSARAGHGPSSRSSPRASPWPTLATPWR